MLLDIGVVFFVGVEFVEKFGFGWYVVCVYFGKFVVDKIGIEVSDKSV